MAAWTIVEIETGGGAWDCYSITPLPGAAPPAPARTSGARATPLVAPGDCIPTCAQEGRHERWECEFLATTDAEWYRILTGRPAGA